MPSAASSPQGRPKGWTRRGRISRTPSSHLPVTRAPCATGSQGNRDRNAALRIALEQAEAVFTSNFGFSRGGPDVWETTVTNPKDTVCLRATDYFLWALQRFYEPRVHPETGETTHEDRYLNAVWPQISQVHDLHIGPAQGTFFTRANPLTLDNRFGAKLPKKKKPQV